MPRGDGHPGGCISRLVRAEAYHLAEQIQKLRQEAKAQGLDPNRWFNNVELVVAKRIGRETVQYVGNIYKYYLAYKMVTEKTEQRTGAANAAKVPVKK